MTTRTRVVMSGPLPPAVGGMASVLEALASSSLPRQVELRLFETGKTTPAGRPFWQGVAARLSLMRSWWGLFGTRPVPVAHIHTCSGLTFFLDGALVVLSRLRGADVVLHVHGARFDDFLDSLGPVAERIARWIAGRVRQVIVLSPEWEERLRQRWPDARVVVVSNGVPAPVRATEVGRDGPPTFLFLGNLGRRKGVDRLIEAAALAREPWQLLLAGGEEDPGFAGWAREEAQRLGVGGRLQFLGPVVGDDKSRLLAGVQGFVLPSRAEGLPMAMLEAMAVGLPVVVSAVGAMPEVVRDGVEGRVVPPDDAPMLAAALDGLSREPQARQRLGDAAAERCQALYGIERMVDSLLGVYTRLDEGK